MAPPNRQKAFAQEELRNANLLRERGDILIQSNVDLAQAQGCYKKALGIARRFAEDERAVDICFACNLGIAQIGTIKWINARTDNATSRTADKPQSAAASSRPATSMPLTTRPTATARQETPAVRTARLTQHSEGAAQDLEVATDPSAAKEDIWNMGGGSDGKALLSIEEASALTRASRKSRYNMHAITSKSVWGPNGGEGIAPEELIAQQRQKLTHSWGPKPGWVARPCRMKEGDVTKRIRMDRDRLAGVGSKKQWVANRNEAGRPNEAARSALFFRPVPLAVVQQDRRLVGLPLQRTRALSTDPVMGRAGSNLAGEWALRQVAEQVGGGGPAITVYGHDLGVGIWPRQQRHN